MFVDWSISTISGYCRFNLENYRFFKIDVEISYMFLYKVLKESIGIANEIDFFCIFFLSAELICIY